jgi:hypothetical protein
MRLERMSFDIEGPSLPFTGSFAIATTAHRVNLEVRATEPLAQGRGCMRPCKTPRGCFRG